MKIECLRDKLLVGITSAEKVTGKNLALPVLSGVLLETSKNSIIIRATNLDLGIELTVPAKVIEEGSVVVPAGILSGYVANLVGDKVTLESTDESLVVVSGESNAVMRTLSKEEFPIIPRVVGDRRVPIDSGLIVLGLKSVWYSAATSSMKPELSSIYIHTSEENLVFAATDSFRLAEKRVPVKKAKDIGTVLVPFKNIPEIIRFLETSRGEVVSSGGDNQISFEGDGMYLVSRVIDGTFPDYRQIIPKDIKTEAVVLKQDFINILKLNHVMSDTFNQVIFRIVPGEKTFEISTKNTSVGENHSSLQGVLKGEDITISFNYKYLIDCLQSIDSDSLFLGFQGMSRPVIIKGVGDSSFVYIVMPMNR